MKSIAELIGATDFEELIKHPRFKLLDIIEKRINHERQTDGFKKLPMRVYAIKTSHLSLEDLDFLVKKSSQSPNFGKVFFGMLKPKDGNLTQSFRSKH